MGESNITPTYKYLLFLAPVVYWLAFFAVVSGVPFGPAAWNILVLFALIGTPIVILVICAMQLKKKPFTWPAVAGFSFAMVLLSGFFVFRFSSTVPFAHGGR
jgi:hypothetical protein